MGELNPRIGSFDLETFVDEDNNSIAYCAGFYTNADSNPTSYYLTDFNNSSELLLTCLNNMLNKKYHNYVFYCHNFQNYDLVYIYCVLENYNLKVGYKYYVLNIIPRDGLIISLDIKKRIEPTEKIEERESISKKGKYVKISIVDSINILNNSLSKLAKDFDLKNSKGFFPYSFVNRNRVLLEYSLSFFIKKKAHK